MIMMVMWQGACRMKNVSGSGKDFRALPSYLHRPRYYSMFLLLFLLPSPDDLGLYNVCVEGIAGGVLERWHYYGTGN